MRLLSSWATHWPHPPDHPAPYSCCESWWGPSQALLCPMLARSLPPGTRAAVGLPLTRGTLVLTQSWNFPSVTILELAFLPLGGRL